MSYKSGPLLKLSVTASDVIIQTIEKKTSVSVGN